jgi:hypothetical protein
MRDGVTYEELGADYFNRRHAEKAVRRHVKQLEALGFHVTIEKLPDSHTGGNRGTFSEQTARLFLASAPRSR